jgi:hypothetical protein
MSWKGFQKAVARVKKRRLSQAHQANDKAPQSLKGKVGMGEHTKGKP